MLINKVKVKNIITKSKLPGSDFAANPYIGCSHACKYCYASFMNRFTNHCEDWGTFIDVKYWEPIRNLSSLNGNNLFIGSVTDPYLPQEKTFKRTRALLEEIIEADPNITISTKSDLILRDIDLIKQFSNITVAWSINTLDENFKRDMDRGVSIKRRLMAMESFHNVGIKTTCFISPIFPILTSVESIVDVVSNKCDFIWLENLNLRGTYKKEILRYIQENYPESYSTYNQIYNCHDLSYWQDLDCKIREFANNKGYNYILYKDFNSFDVPPLFTNGQRDNKPVIINCFYHNEIKRK